MPVAIASYSRLRSSRVFLVAGLLAAGLSPALAMPAATSTTLAITSGGTATTSVVSGTVVTLTATVKAGATAVQLGQVNFCDATAAHCNDVHLLGTAQLATAGTAVLKFVPAPGSHSYKAEFAGSAADAASSSSASALTVEIPTTTAIAQSGSAGNYTLKSTVTASGTIAFPTGAVSFLDTTNGNKVLGSATLGTSTEGFSWTTPQSPATAPNPQSIVVADFNGDGILDIAIGTNGTATTNNLGSLNILLGNGDGTFQAAKKFTGLPNNRAMVAAPFVHGGPLDILTVDNNSTGTNNAAMFIGDGKGGGTLGAPFSLGGIANVTAVSAGDFNRDGNQDFVITGVIYGVYCFAPVLGNGDGTFGGPTLNAIGNNPLLVAVGAFNTNGYPDIVVADTVVGQVTLFQNNSQGYFFPEGQANTGTNPTAMVTGDFNGDGYLDLAVVNGGSDNVTILLGKGNETLTASPQSPATGHHPTSIAVGDFNGDGIADLAITNSSADTVTVLLGKGDGTFTAEPDLDTGTTPISLATGAFTSGGTSDIAIANEDSASITGSTATILLSQLTQTATATATGITPSGSGAHLVDASFPAAADFAASISSTTSLTGSTTQTVATPILSPAAGTYNAPQSVKITEATAGTTIHYTTNGSVPLSSSPIYTAPISVIASETINAIAINSAGVKSPVATAAYVIAKPVAPVFTPAAGTYSAPQSVKITEATAGTTIHYTTNGSAPLSSSSIYTAPISVTATETINAIAINSAGVKSPVATAAYVIAKPVAPVFTPAAGTYSAPQSVKITEATAGTTIHYTTNGSVPLSSSPIYTAPISVVASETINAIAINSAGVKSPVATGAYVIAKPVAPVFSPVAGTYSAPQSVKITEAIAGTTIHYTTNGSVPVSTSPTYTGPITVSASETISAIAINAAAVKSPVTTAAYVIGTIAATPAFSPAAGTYVTAQSVKITCTTNGATIYYTTNGTTPTTASTKYTAPIAVTASETIKAIAVATGFSNSAVASAAYVIEAPTATPTFSIAAGTYATAQSVTITDATAGAVIYYTTNGTAPTTASTKYTAAITVSTTEIVKAIAVATGHTNSTVATAQYTIGLVATPAFSLAAGTYATAQNVTITDATAGATIYYTTNGATPTPSSTQYTAAIPVSASETIEAIAVATGLADSKIAEATYDIGANIAAIPVLSPLPGAYSTPRTVTITDTTPGAVITYTTGIGSTTNTYTYTGPFTVSSTEYIAFDAIAPGYTRSPASEVIYTIGQVPAPVFTPAAGTYGTAQAVNIIDETPSATIFYTTDGSAPTAASAIYTGPIIVSSSETIHALAVATGVPSSPIASAAYTIGKGVATPAFSVPAGSYTTTQSVGITDITPGATIYYTTNGTAPTTASTKYTAPIAVSASETLEAIAVATGYTNSAIATAAYTIGYPIETFAATASGDGVVTVPVGGQSAFVVAASNGSGQSFPSITVSTSTGSNPSLPVVVTLCQTNAGTGQCLAAPAPTVTLSSFAPGANASFSVFVTATAAIANSPANQIYVLFKNPGGTVEGSTNVAVDTN